MGELYVNYVKVASPNAASKTVGSTYRPASPLEVLEAARQLEGAQVRQWPGPIALHPKGRPDLGDDLPAGAYLVVPLGVEVDPAAIGGVVGEKAD